MRSGKKPIRREKRRGWRRGGDEEESTREEKKKERRRRGEEHILISPKTNTLNMISSRSPAINNEGVWNISYDISEN